MNDVIQEKDQLPALVSLSDAIEMIRGDLEAALERGRKSDVHFEADSVEIELQVAFKKVGGAEAGVRFGVVNVGAKGSIESGETHKIVLTLKPVDVTGSPLRLGDHGTD